MAGVARELPAWISADAEQVQRFHFSENAELDLNLLDKKLRQHRSPVIWVLLLATGSSSHLWFDPEHCPKHLELCRHLRDGLGFDLNFVVCPTSTTARQGWPDAGPLQATDGVQRAFRQFWPAGRGSARVWHGFCPKEACCDAGAVSLVRGPHELQPALAKVGSRTGMLPARMALWCPSSLLLLLAVATSHIHRLSTILDEQKASSHEALEQERSRCQQHAEELEKARSEHELMVTQLASEKRHLAMDLEKERSQHQRLAKELEEVRFEHQRTVQVTQHCETELLENQSAHQCVAEELDEVQADLRRCRAVVDTYESRTNSSLAEHIQRYLPQDG